MRSPRSADGGPRLRESVFLPVAGILVSALMVTGIGAVAVSAFLWEARSAELVRNSLALRLDLVAEELEARAEFQSADVGEASSPILTDALRMDLRDRFPDPVAVISAEGAVLDAPRAIDVPPEVRQLLAEGRTVVELDDDPPWAITPLYDPDGLPAGGLLVRPLDASIERELEGTREATRQALWIIAMLALIAALVLGALLTARLVAPLQRMTNEVERIGAGDYAARLPAHRPDEFGRLAAAINEMARRVESSIDALRATDRLRRELVANIGHDLRTPLAAMQGYLEEADRLSAEGRPDEAAHALTTARRQAAHVERLVRDLFELSLLDATAGRSAERPPIIREPVPLAELLHQAAETHRPALAAADISFEAHIPSDLPTIEADGARLLRALDNLLENARRHTPPGGRIELKGEVDDGEVLLTIADTGEGLPPDARDHIFERYYRGTSSRTREHEGSGLGLAIVRAIARAHGGEVWVASEAGEGSRFTISLPTGR